MMVRLRALRRSSPVVSLAAATALAWNSALAQAPVPSDYRPVGSIAPRSAAQLAASGVTSPFSIGTETTDRGFSTYAAWGRYAGPLGAPKARVQSGWAPHERSKGVYDFSGLDPIIDGLRAQGVQPWVDLVYGNPIYEGGGGITLGAGLPTGDGREAWLRFVERIVAHYGGPTPRVTEWEIWNEPDGGKPIPAEEFAAFAVQTAQVIKRVQPEAKIVLAGFTTETQKGVGTWGYDYARTIVTQFDARKGAAIPDADVSVTYHPYDANPDTSYGPGFNDFRTMVESAGFRVRQGENGAPSVNQPEFALSRTDWTETSQAKYALRRLLGDFSRGIETSLFTLVDLHYRHAKNTKGLLLTGAWDKADTTEPPLYGDQAVKRSKVGYGAVQNLFSTFDDRLKPIADHGCKAPAGYTVQAYRRGTGRAARNMLAVWRSTDRPGANETPAAIGVICVNFQVSRSPQYADLLSGRVYALPSRGVVMRTRRGVRLSKLPVYDSPVLVAEEGLVPITPRPRSRAGAPTGLAGS